MATLPDERALGERPVPQASGSVASYNVPGASNRGSILAGAGSQIAQAGDIIEETNKKWDAISAEDAFNKLKEKAASLQYDPQSGFAQARGGNAVGQDFTKQYTDQFSDAAAGIAGSLKNQQQKLMFQQRVGIAAAQFQSSLLQHQAQQTTVFGNDTDASRVKNGLNAIAANPYDDGRYDTEMMGIHDALAGKFQRNGYSADMAKNEMATVTSAALASRTAGMMLDNPMKAAQFFHAHELDFEPSQRLDLARQLKTTVDAQTARADGAAAFNDAKGAVTTGTPAQAPLPANMNADHVRPYDQDTIDNLVKQVKSPFKYDALVKETAAKYNISPNELKLRIMAESGGRPDASSDQGAVGLAQLTAETAARLGVKNRMDPAQSIDAAGKLMASYGGTLGGDMSKVDQMYYGPATPNGPNTKQYVENLRAVRAQLFGAAATPAGKADIEAMEGPTIANAKAYAEAKRPGDLVYQDQVVQEARKNWSQALGVQRANDYANFSNVLQSSIGDNGARSLSDLSPQQQMTFAQLPPQNQHSLMTLWAANQRSDDKGDKIVQNEDTNRKTLTLMGQALNDPVAFKSRNIAADITDLPTHQQNQVMSAWMSIDKTAAKGANYQHALAVMKPAMEIAKIKIPNAAEKGSTASYDDYNAYTALLGNAVDSFMEQNKRAPTDTEIKSIAAPLLAQATVKGARYFGFGDVTEPAFKLKPDEEARATINMTPLEKASVTQKLQARYGYAPTEAQIQTAKMLSVLHSNDPAALSTFDRAMKEYKAKSQSQVGVIKP
jgi:hypothetical protein